MDWLRSGFSALLAENPPLAIGLFVVVWLLLGVPIFFWLKSGPRSEPRRRTN